MFASVLSVCFRKRTFVWVVVVIIFVQDYHSLNGALLSANSVLKRYRYTFKSDALFNELKHIVLPHMAVSLQCTHPLSPPAPPMPYYAPVTPVIR